MRVSTTAQPETTNPAGRPQHGPRLLEPPQRARLETMAAEGRLLAAAWARFRLRTDTNRRRNAAARAEARNGTPPVRSTVTGVVGPGGGRWRSIARPAEFRGTTAQVAGLWPWSVGAGAPLIGTPLGPHLDTGAPVCFDPLNWFSRGGFLTAPSLFVLGLNGFGKSSLVRRIVLGGIAQGIAPLVLADVKPDYRDVVAACGGQVIDLGYGHGRINPLDGGVMGHAVRHLEDAGLHDAAATLREELRARQTTLIAALCELVRGRRVDDFEETLIATALRILHAPTAIGGRGFHATLPPTIEDLAAVIAAGGEELALDAAAATEVDYQAAIVPLRRSLRALGQGPFGRMFNGQTTQPIDFDSVGVCIDVSRIPKGDRKLKAAVMLVCWAAGFSAIEALNLLTDLGLARQRYFQVVMDELWQVLSLGEFMIERVDELTRLQRDLAAALIMISHTIKDLQALGAAADRALGFLERSRAKIVGALPADEIERLDSRVKFTDAEAAMVTSWSAPHALAEPPKRDEPRPVPAGVGKFLMKFTEDRTPGVPFALQLTAIERTYLADTSRRFDAFGRSGSASSHRQV